MSSNKCMFLGIKVKGFRLVGAAFMIIATQIQAADTIETWGVGDGNFEMYGGLDGMVEEAAGQEISGSVLMGWGVAERLSAYMTMATAADGTFSQADPSIGLGLFGTPFDTEHIDLDLGLELGAFGAGFENPVLSPSLELNLDQKSQNSLYGIYLRARADYTGQDQNVEPQKRQMDVNFTVGSYLTLDYQSQLLLEYDITVLDEPDFGANEVEKGNLALGYNRMLGHNLEWVSELRLCMANDGKKSRLGMMLGLIATLP